MSVNYLWSDQLPAKDKSGLTMGTQNYFDVNLRYRQNRTVEYAEDTYGDRFSQIEKTEGTKSRAAATEMDYDFGFMPIYVTFKTGDFAFVQVLYVVPGSPAETAGLRRGDAFKQISGQDLISIANCQNLLNESEEITLKILNRTDTPSITINKGSYYNNPVLFKDILEISGQKIGYLVYNHFTSGDNSGPASYSTKLKNVFKDFKDKGVTKLILDLRYNGGGEVANARLLASLIVGSGNLGKTWMYMERNKHKKDPTKFEEAKFMTPSEVGGTKAEIDELFVITSDHTASASELIIHTLRPFYGYNLHVTGLTTVGKNLGSREFKKSGIPWTMHPITMRVYDKNKVSGYEEGIAPDKGMEMDEYWGTSSSYPYFHLAPLGDMNSEWLLNLVYKYFTKDMASAPNAYYNRSRSAGQDFKATADIQERGLTEPPQIMP